MEPLQIHSLIRSHSEAPITLSELYQVSSFDEETVIASVKQLEEQNLIQRAKIPPKGDVYFCKTIFMPFSPEFSKQESCEEEKKQEQDEELQQLRAEWKRKSTAESSNLRQSKNQYFRALREYNYLKDLAHGLVSILSEKRECGSKEVLKEFEFDEVEKSCQNT